MYKTVVRHNLLDWIDSMKSRGPQSLDKVVGRNVRVHRLAKGMSQTDLANELGITFQQIQKYEKGTNRVGSGRLFQIAALLEVPVTAFFEGGDTQASVRTA